MTFPTSRQVDSAEAVAESLDAALSQMLDQVQAFRAEVAAANSVSSLTARSIYQVIAAARRYALDLIDTPGLAEAYMRRFTNLTGFNPGAEWATAQGELTQTIVWLQGALPKDTNGRPVFDSFNPTTGELTDYQIPLSSGAKTALLTRLDALLAVFG